MGLIKEFREFINKGNVVDLAVGVVIGAAFGKIVASLVNDIVSPIVGLVSGTTNFAAWKIVLKAAATDAAGKPTDPVTLNIGSFLQASLDFIIIAFVIFLMVRAFNKMKRKEEEKPSAPPVPSKEEVLLGEIRDLLKK